MWWSGALLCKIKRSYRRLIKNVSDSFVSLDELESANSDGVNSELPPLPPSFSNGPLSFKQRYIKELDGFIKHVCCVLCNFVAQPKGKNRSFKQCQFWGTGFHVGLKSQYALIYDLSKIYHATHQKKRIETFFLTLL